MVPNAPDAGAPTSVMRENLAEQAVLVEQRVQQAGQIQTDLAAVQSLIQAHRMRRLNKYALDHRWSTNTVPSNLTPDQLRWWAEWASLNLVMGPPAPPSSPASAGR